MYDGVPKAFQNADLVFRGKITNVEYVDFWWSFVDRLLRRPVERSRLLVTMDVAAIWKGDLGRTVVLSQHQGFSSCSGFWTEPGTELLIFAVRYRLAPPQPDTLEIPSWRDRFKVGTVMTTAPPCTYNDEVRNAAETLQQLGPPTGNKHR